MSRNRRLLAVQVRGAGRQAGFSPHNSKHHFTATPHTRPSTHLAKLLDCLCQHIAILHALNLAPLALAPGTAGMPRGEAPQQRAT